MNGSDPVFAEGLDFSMMTTKGAGKVKISNRSDGYYKVRVANQISFDKVLRGYDLRTFSIQLLCVNCIRKEPSPKREPLRLGRLDSNQRMRESKSRALPLGYTPVSWNETKGRSGRPGPQPQYGVGNGTRTHNTRNHNPVLCQLNYTHHMQLFAAIRRKWHT